MWATKTVARITVYFTNNFVKKYSNTVLKIVLMYDFLLNPTTC